jgi:hypothetical protein
MEAAMAMPDNREPTLIGLLREQRQALLAGERTQMREMARRWLELEQTLEGMTMSLALEIERMRELGIPITEGKIMQLERYQSLLLQVRAEVDLYARYADDLIRSRQSELAALGASDAGTALTTAMRQAGVGAYFNRLPVQAVQAMVGLAGDGSPLYQLLGESYGDAAQGLTAKLLEGVALGYNPVKTAHMMADGMGMGLNRALVVASTEQLRVYREASRLQYQESGVVKGYRRMAKHAQDVCAACLMAEGTFYKTEETFEEHPSGHCTLLPVIEGLKEPKWTYGEAWFRAQNDSVQEQILGSGHFRAWKEGKFKLKDIVKRKTDPVWGSWLSPAPLTELVKG